MELRNSRAVRIWGAMLVGVLALATVAPTANAASGRSARGFGLGIVLGEPTGITGKLWERADRAWDFGFAYSFDDFALLYSDLLFHFPDAFGRSSRFVAELKPYAGIGGVIAISGSKDGRKDRAFYARDDDGLGLGIRIPLGIEWLPATAPIGVFAELVPGMTIISRTSGFLEAGIGARYYF